MKTMENNPEYNRRATDRIKPKLIAIVGGAIVAILFTIFGLALPHITQRLFPDNQDYYYYDKSPIGVNKTTYYPCDPVLASVRRTAKDDTQGEFYRDLVLYRRLQGGVTEEITVYNIKTVSTITEGEADVNLVFELPCNLVPGTYFWKGLIVYKIKGVEHNYRYETEKFLVEEAPKVTPSPTITIVPVI
jgi:hypothetical protein